MFNPQPLLIEDIKHIIGIQEGYTELQWTHDAFTKEVLNPKSICLKVTDSNQIIGYLIANIIIDECHITNVFVKSQFRAQGVGSALMDRLLNILSYNGIKRVFLELRLSNTNAIKLYEKYGFKRVAIRKDLYSNPPEDGIFMLRVLL